MNNETTLEAAKTAVAESSESKPKRGGRRPGAGRKPNYAKRLEEFLARRDPRLAALTELEIRCLGAILRKLQAARVNGPHNQKESNTAIEAAGVR
jgi:hypothetical protein